MAIHSLPPGSDGAALQAAIDQATFGDIIELTGDMPFSDTVTVRQGLEIYIQSSADNKWTMYQFNPEKRHFEIDGSLILEHVVLDGRYTSGGVQLNRGAFAMQHDAVIENCFADNGGGVEVISGVFSIYDGDTGKPFPLKGGEIRNNVATNGGGVYLTAGLFNMSASTGTIQSNKANDGGGVYANGGTYRLTAGDVSHNESTNNGGGIYVASPATLYVSGNASTITHNSAQNGGGIYMEDATYDKLTTSGASFRCNRASEAHTPPEDAATRYPDIQCSETSIMDHLLNHYDINCTEGEPVRVTRHVSYQANGGTGSHTGPEVYPCDTDVALAPADAGIQWENHSFLGWNTNADGTGRNYAPGDEITLEGDLILYAQWKAPEPPCYKHCYFKCLELCRQICPGMQRSPHCRRFYECFCKKFCKRFCESFCLSDNEK